MEILFTDKALLTRGGVVGEPHFTVKKISLYIFISSLSRFCPSLPGLPLVTLAVHGGRGSQLSYDNIFASSVE